jgi:EAL domain-containing protein (putative c-di-GMP-specific phosphodiesterase class I)/CheY-like chemotaxis protein
MDRIRVMLADDEDLVLDAMSDLISSDPALDVVGTARDARQAVRLARIVAPDVALVDVRMPAGGGAVATRGIRRESPPTRVVAVSADADPEAVVAMLDAGASGYVGKDEPVEQILRAVHRAVDGRASIAISSAGLAVEHLVERGAGTSARERRAAADRIARVIDGPALEMVYQPIVRLSDGRVVGLEALARFRTTPRHRPPDAWFAEAASVGLLLELELAAIERALMELDRIPEGTFLSLNVSPEVMCSDELAPLLDPVADRLVLEMTEGSPLRDHEQVREKLRPLRDRGARLAIDDVGAGYAGLARVVLLEPELMKLDRSVVAGASEDRRRRALIGRLVAFCGDVGIDMIAEGIEMPADLEVLRSLSVPFGQGFHLGRPGPLPRAVGDPISWPGRHAFRRRG